VECGRRPAPYLTAEATAVLDGVDERLDHLRPAYARERHVGVAHVLAGLFSLCFGLFMVYETGFVEGPLL